MSTTTPSSTEHDEVAPRAPRRRSSATVASSDKTSSSQRAAKTKAKSNRVAVLVRLPADEYQRLQYWAAKREYSSVNEYMCEAIVEQIRRENLDYDLPTLEIARLNELVDQVKALSVNSSNLERVIQQGFDSLIGLTRGDSYLFDAEDGELP